MGGKGGGGGEVLLISLLMCLFVHLSVCSDYFAHTDLLKRLD